MFDSQNIHNVDYGIYCSNVFDKTKIFIIFKAFPINENKTYIFDNTHYCVLHVIHYCFDTRSITVLNLIKYKQTKRNNPNGLAVIRA